MYQVQGQAGAIPPHGLTGALQLLGQMPSTANGNPNATSTLMPVANASGPMSNAINSAAQMGAQRTTGAQGYANQGIKDLGKWVNPGVQANNVQAALSGALGPEAQAQAYANFNESPAQAFLREQGERALMRNAAATGGLQGGNVLKELTRYGQGVASQDFQNYYDRLGGVANRGMEAQGLRSGLYGKKADAAISAASNAAQIQAASIGAGGSLGAAQIASDTALMRDAGRYAYEAGLNNANNIRNTTSGLSQYINNQGQNMGGMYNTGMTNLANILMTGGRDASTNATNRANTLSGLRLTGSGQYSGLTNLGARGQDNTLQNAGNIISGVAGVFG